LQSFLDNHDLHRFPHKTLVGSGAVAEQVSRFARELAPDLIVIGTHGRTGVNKFLIGSVAEQVFRTSTCPVLTVGPHVARIAQGSTFNTVVVATDFGESCANALIHGFAIAEQNSGRLLVLHAVDENGLAIQGWVDEVIPRAEMRVRKWASRILPRMTVPWLPLARFGHPANVLLRVATQQRADLIVMGARYSTHPNVAAHSIGATAYHVIADAGAPVLTVSEAGRERYRENQ
jgi:nucleotide-binding universal stress UspA family protein